VEENQSGQHQDEPTKSPSEKSPDDFAVDATAPAVPKESSSPPDDEDTGEDSASDAVSIEATLPGAGGPQPRPRPPIEVPGYDETVGGPTPDSIHETAAAPGTDEPSDEPADGLVGTVLGGCRLEKCVGRGAMGVVYRATQIRLKREVAVKIIRPELCGDEDLVEQFKNEAISGGQMKTPNVVQVYDVGSEKGMHFIVMEFVEGGNLKEYLEKEQKKKLLVDEALNFMMQAARGLEEAERLGIIHRDIKPDNLLLDETNTIKIADFGISKMMHADIGLTQSGQIKGTPLYMSPEQCKGEKLDSRSDIYSLGATFYHLLTGRPPADGNTFFEVTKFKTEQEHLSPKESLRDAPESVNRIIERMTALELEDRYSSLPDLVLDLECATRGQALTSPPPKPAKPRPERLPPPEEKPEEKEEEPEPVPPSRWKLWLAIAAGVVVVSAGAYYPFRTEVNAWVESLVVEPELPGKPDTERERLERKLATYRRDYLTQSLQTLPLVSDLGEEIDASKYPILHARCRTLLGSATEEAERYVDKVMDKAGEEMEKGHDPSKELRPLLAAIPGGFLSDRRSKVETLLHDLLERSFDRRIREIQAELDRAGPGQALLGNAEKLKKDLDEVESLKDGEAAEKISTLVDEIEWGKSQLVVAPTSAAVPFASLEKYARTARQLIATVQTSHATLASWAAGLEPKDNTALFKMCETAVKRYVADRKKAHEDSSRDKREAAYNESNTQLSTSKANLIAVFPSDARSVQIRKWIDPHLAVYNTKIAAILAKKKDDVHKMKSLSEKLAATRKDIDDLESQANKLEHVAQWLGMKLEDKVKEYGTRLGDFDAKERKVLEGKLKVVGEIGEKWAARRAAIGAILSQLGRQEVGNAERAVGELGDDALPSRHATTAFKKVTTDLRDGFAQATVALDFDASLAKYASARTALGGLPDFEGARVQAATYITRSIDAVRALKDTVAGMARIPGGHVKIDRLSFDDDVPSFFLGKAEVTRAEMAAFAGSPREKVEWRGIWDTQQRMNEDLRRLANHLEPIGEGGHAVDGVNHRIALAYARFKKHDLMSYEQWWRAARDIDGVKSRFGWGDKWEMGSNWQSKTLSKAVSGLASPANAKDKVYHLSGNVAEFLKRPGKRVNLIGGSYRDIANRHQDRRKRFSGDLTQRVDVGQWTKGGGLRTAVCPADELTAIQPK
jgi:serine/threonine protein kinase/formylglycine-generating enzyme required for sulfatase activity